MDPSYHALIADALRSVRVDRYDANGATYVTLVAPHGPGHDRVTFNIRLTAATAELVHVTASVHGSDGRQKFCGFVAPGMEPMCPVYQHL
jgi:hypothetical protein